MISLLPPDSTEAPSVAGTAVSWAADVSGDWSDGSDWSSGVAPNSTDDVTIGVPGTYTITVSVAEAADALTLENSGATLQIDAALNVGSLTAEGGIIASGAGDTLTVAGATSFGVDNDGPRLAGPGTLVTSGTVTSTTVAAVDSTGTIDVTSGTLDLAGGVSGKGRSLIGDGNAVESAATTGQSVDFSGSGFLQLDDPTEFSHSPSTACRPARRPVETLVPGDQVVTLSGALRPVI